MKTQWENTFKSGWNHLSKRWDTYLLRSKDASELPSYFLLSLENFVFYLYASHIVHLKILKILSTSEGMHCFDHSHYLHQRWCYFKQKTPLHGSGSYKPGWSHDTQQCISGANRSFIMSHLFSVVRPALRKYLSLKSPF